MAVHHRPQYPGVYPTAYVLAGRGTAGPGERVLCPHAVFPGLPAGRGATLLGPDAWPIFFRGPARLWPLDAAHPALPTARHDCSDAGESGAHTPTHQLTMARPVSTMRPLSQYDRRAHS